MAIGSVSVSPSGGYFYDAHLSSYERDWKEGDSIKAGEILGIMGETVMAVKVQREKLSGTSASRDLHSDTVFEGDERKPKQGARRPFRKKSESVYINYISMQKMCYNAKVVSLLNQEEAGATFATSHQGSDFYGNTVMEKYIMSI